MGGKSCTAAALWSRVKVIWGFLSLFLWNLNGRVCVALAATPQNSRISCYKIKTHLQLLTVFPSVFLQPDLAQSVSALQKTGFIWIQRIWSVGSSLFFWQGMGFSPSSPGVSLLNLLWGATTRFSVQTQLGDGPVRSPWDAFCHLQNERKKPQSLISWHFNLNFAPNPWDLGGKPGNEELGCQKCSSAFQISFN